MLGYQAFEFMKGYYLHKNDTFGGFFFFFFIAIVYLPQQAMAIHNWYPISFVRARGSNNRDSIRYSGNFDTLGICIIIE